MKFEKVINEYSNLAYKIAIDMTSSPIDAQDIVQESYLSLYNHFNEYGKLKENEIKNILCKIVLNKSKDYLKSSKRKEITVLEDSLNYYEESINDEIVVNNINRVEEAINKIGEPYTGLLEMYYIKEYSLDKIASKLKTTKGTVKVQITRGKAKLKEILRKERSFMNKLEKIDNLLKKENEFEKYILNLEKIDVCIPKDLNKNIFVKIKNQKKKNYMNICKIAACLIFGLAICRTDFITNDNLKLYTEKQEKVAKVEIQEKFSDMCSLLTTPIKLEGKE